MSSGFYYLNSRYYDPVIGRFLNADAAWILGVEQGNLLEWNLFTYCFNNPVNFDDPSGYGPITAGKIAFWGWRLARAARIARDAALVVGATSIVAERIAQPSWSNPGTRVMSPPVVAANTGVLQPGQLWQCREFANSRASELEKSGQKPLFAEFQFSGHPLMRDNWVVSNTSPIFGPDRAISQTGYHIGVLHGGIIFCNAHPQGLPASAWFNDFQGLGFQNRHIGPIPRGPGL